MTKSADALAERIFAAAIGSFEIAGVVRRPPRLVPHPRRRWAGDARRACCAHRNRRAVRAEWLEQQAAGGILAVDAERRFSLPEAHAAVLAQPESISLMAAAGADGDRSHGAAPSAGRCLSHGVRHRLGGVRGRHAGGAGRPSTGRPSPICSARSGCRAFPTSTSASAAIRRRASLTWGAARAGRASPSRRHTRWHASSASTSTRPRSTRVASTRRPPV